MLPNLGTTVLKRMLALINPIQGKLKFPKKGQGALRATLYRLLHKAKNMYDRVLKSVPLYAVI